MRSSMADVDVDAFLSLISGDAETAPDLLEDVQRTIDRNAQQFGGQKGSGAASGSAPSPAT